MERERLSRGGGFGGAGQEAAVAAAEREILRCREGLGLAATTGAEVAKGLAGVRVAEGWTGCTQSEHE